MSTSPTTRTLTDGVDIPLLGFGTFLIPDDETEDAVAAAIDAGYRHIDTAEVYQNESGVGRGLRRGLERNGLTRDDVFVTTKLWPENHEGSYKSAPQSIDAFGESLARLGLDRVDLYLIHAPFTHDQRLDQWGALAEIHRSGGARAVGVSNFNATHIEELVAAGLPVPHADQIELHPWSQKPRLVSHLNERGIVPIAYSSLVPLSTWRRDTPDFTTGKTDDMRSASEHPESPFAQMADAYGVTEAQLLLRWGVQNGYPVLPKSTNPARMRENADLFGFAISDDDMRRIAGMDRGQGVAWGAVDPSTAQ